MKSISPFQNYKHDIVGKFKDITMAIESLNDDSFKKSSDIEMFYAVHEAILKMLMTSKKTLLTQSELKIDLVIENILRADLPKIAVDGLILRIGALADKYEYFYSSIENQGDEKINIDKLMLLFPISNVRRR